MRNVRFLSGLAVVVSCTWALPSLGAQPGTAAAQEREFVPHGLRIMARTYYAQRRAAERGLAPPGAPWSQKILSGTLQIPVLLVEFANVPHPPALDSASFEKLLFDEAEDPPSSEKRTVTQYFRDMSDGDLTVTGKVSTWYELPEPDTFYENNGAHRMHELLRSALEQADRDMDFSHFDFDRDGKVDTVIIIHSEAGGETDHPAARGNLRSQCWYYSAFAPDGKPFRTNDEQKDGEGNVVRNGDNTPRFVEVDDFVLAPALAVPTLPGGIPEQVKIGVFCHELGHALGLPDLYSRLDNTLSRGLGRWCLMAWGMQGGDGRSSDSPTSLSPWCKHYLGWARTQPVTVAGLINIEPVQQRNQIFRLSLPTSDGKQFLLIEYRSNTWEDAQEKRKVNWDRHLPGSGLAIWYVDETVGTGNGVSADYWPFAPVGAGQNDVPSVRGGGGRSLVSLLQRDGLQQIENGDFGDQNDLFGTGHALSDDPSSPVSTALHDGTRTGILIEGIEIGTLAKATVRLASSEHGAAGAESIASRTGGTNRILGPAAAPAPALAEGRRERQPVTTRPAAGPITADRLRDRSSRLAPPPPPRPETQPIGEPERPRTQVQRVRDATPDQLQRLRNVSIIGEKLKAGGSNRLDEIERYELTSLTAQQVQQFPVEARQELLQAAALERRTTFSGTTRPRSEVETRLVQLSRRDPIGSMTVQMAPGVDHPNRPILAGDVRQLIDVTLPTYEVGLKENTTKLIQQDLGMLIPKGVELRPTEDLTGKPPEPNEPLTYQQVIQVDGKPLPLWGSHVKFFTGADGKSTVQFNTTDPRAIRVEGTLETMTPEQARDFVASELGFNPKSVQSATPGISSAEGQAEVFRLAYRIVISTGPGHRDLTVFFDAQSKKILRIE